MIPIRDIVSAALSAPTMGNAQYWRYTWSPPELRVVFDRARHTWKKTDPTLDVVGWMSLGFLIETVALAARARGFQALIDTGELEARFRFEPAPVDASLALEERHRDTRPFQSARVPEPLVTALKGDCAPGIGFALVEKPPALLVEAICECESRIPFGELAPWFRLSKEEALRTRDGVFVEAPALARVALRACRTRAGAALLLPFIGGRLRRETRARWRTLFAEGSACGLLTVQVRAPTSLVAVGRTAMRQWVRLCGVGFGYHPCEAPALAAYWQRPDAPRLDSIFALDGSDAIPAWLFRTGVSLPLPLEQRTLRRPLAAVFSEHHH